MSRPISIVQYWGGCPQTMNSKWQRFLRVIECCAEKGWRTCLVWSRMPEDPALYEPFEQAGCQILFQRRASRNFDIRCVWSTYRMLRKLRCDVFHCHNVHTSPLIAAALARVPIRVWSKLAMSPYYEQGIEPTGIHRLALSTRVSSGLSHRILARSTAVAEELLNSGTPSDKIITTPVDVDIQRFANASANGVRQRLGLSSSDTVICTVGHAVPVKGWDILLPAFAKLARRNDSLRLLMIGSTTGSSETHTAATLAEMVAKLGIEKRVMFLGMRSDVPELLHACDLFILPSRSEGQPAALVEAMAAGLPCIGARVGGITDVIQDGDNGLLFEREDVDGLVDRISRLLDDETFRKRITIRAQHSAEAFDLKDSSQRLVRLYGDLLRLRGPTGVPARP